MESEMSPQSAVAPHLFDPTKLFLLRAPVNPLENALFGAGATSIVQWGHGGMAGVYVDNETPNRDTVAADMVARRVQLVLVGLYPREVGKTLPGCITLLEWYPFPEYAGDSLPKHEGYITQWNYATPGYPAPTRAQREKLYGEARDLKPKLVLCY
jgi:hypothetical protein